MIDVQPNTTNIPVAGDAAKNSKLNNKRIIIFAAVGAVALLLIMVSGSLFATGTPQAHNSVASVQNTKSTGDAASAAVTEQHHVSLSVSSASIKNAIFRNRKATILGICAVFILLVVFGVTLGVLMSTDVIEVPIVEDPIVVEPEEPNNPWLKRVLVIGICAVAMSIFILSCRKYSSIRNSAAHAELTELYAKLQARMLQLRPNKITEDTCLLQSWNEEYMYYHFEFDIDAPHHPDLTVLDVALHAILVTYNGDTDPTWFFLKTDKGGGEYGHILRPDEVEGKCDESFAMECDESGPGSVDDVSEMTYTKEYLAILRRLVAATENYTPADIDEMYQRLGKVTI